MYCNIVNGLTLKFEFNSGSTDRSPSFSSAFYYMLIYIYIYIYMDNQVFSLIIKKKKKIQYHELHASSLLFHFFSRVIGFIGINLLCIKRFYW